MESPVVEVTVQQGAIGRIVVPPKVPKGFAVFYTTLDFHGRLDQPNGDLLSGVIREQFGITATITSCTQIHGTTVRRGGAPAHLPRHRPPAPRCSARRRNAPP